MPPTVPSYEIRRSSIQGRGAFATRLIRKGQRFAEYTGEAISHEEADSRYDDNDGRHHTFLFVLDEDTVIDARKFGSDARYINHSCDPSAETIIEDDRIWVEAIRTIRAGEEITYDYRFEWQDDYEPEDIRYYACKCGSSKCRGTILRVPVYLRPTVREWLAGNDVPKPRKPRKKGKKAAKKIVKKVVKKSAKKAVKKALKKSTKKKSVKKAKKVSRKSSRYTRR